MITLGRVQEGDLLLYYYPIHCIRKIYCHTHNNTHNNKNSTAKMHNYVHTLNSLTQDVRGGIGWEVLCLVLLERLRPVLPGPSAWLCVESRG